MEPRWNMRWYARDVHYVGGYERFDLYVARQPHGVSVRVVWGTSHYEWHGLHGLHHVVPGLGNPPSFKELEGIRLYLKMFVPEVPDGTV